MKVKGFTLIEMLVVVLIVGILASIGVPQYQRAVIRARYVKLMPVVKAVKNAEEEFWYMDRRYATRFGTGTDGLNFSARGFSGTGETLSHRDMQITINPNSGNPRIDGDLFINGERVMGYRVFLDHQTDSSNVGGRQCCCYHGCTNPDSSYHKYFELCGSITGAAAEGACFKFP